MCGRFVIFTDPAALAERVSAVNEAGTAAPNFNVAPTATVATVVSRHDAPDDTPTRRVRLMRWGLVPPWTRAGADGAPQSGRSQLINARAETVTSSPAFRSSARHRRCLVPMDGFYEWRAEPDTPAGKRAGKTPFYIYRGDGDPLFAAGLWSVWHAPGQDSGPPLLSCTIITTTAAVGELAGIHDRMPLLLAERDWDGWLDPDAAPDAALLSRPPDVRELRLHRVSTLVNNVRNNGPELIGSPEPRARQARLPW